MRGSQARLETEETPRPNSGVLRKVHALDGEMGRIAAIEPRSGTYFLGDTLLEAVSRGRRKYPGAAFDIVRVGHPAANVQHGGPRRIKR